MRKESGMEKSWREWKRGVLATTFLGFLVGISYVMAGITSLIVLSLCKYVFGYERMEQEWAEYTYLFMVFWTPVFVNMGIEQLANETVGKDGSS